MPTGYTAKLAEGPQSFKDFLFGCAHASGALITLRDEAPDSPIPEEFKPSPYHLEALEKAKAELSRVKGLSLKQCEKEAEAEYERGHAYYLKYLEEATSRYERHRGMMRDVERWCPPSKDHEELKKFMLNQLQISMEGDSPESLKKWHKPPTKLSGAEWQAEKIALHARSVEYHRKEAADDAARAASRTQWVRLLRESV